MYSYIQIDKQKKIFDKYESVFYMAIKVYIAEKFGQDVVNQITQIFDFSQNLTRFNKNTNRTLTNYQYNMLVINEAFNDWQENK